MGYACRKLQKSSEAVHGIVSNKNRALLIILQRFKCLPLLQALSSQHTNPGREAGTPLFLRYLNTPRRRRALWRTWVPCSVAPETRLHRPDGSSCCTFPGGGGQLGARWVPCTASGVPAGTLASCSTQGSILECERVRGTFLWDHFESTLVCFSRCIIHKSLAFCTICTSSLRRPRCV